MTADTKGRLAGLVTALLLFPVYFLLAHFTNENRGFLVVCVMLVFAGIIYVLRKKALKPRLLLPIAVLFAVELSTAFLVPLPSKIPGYTMIPISITNGVLLLWILSHFDRTLDDHNEHGDPDAEGPRYSG